MKEVPKHNHVLLLVLTSIGIVCILVGGISALCSTKIFNYVLSRMLYLSPSSRHYETWKNPPFPVTLSIYLFNWTNPKELLQGIKPELVEVGPYVFREHLEKVNITWNDNYTVSYRIVRRWYFDEELSQGSLQDNITTLNVLSATAAYISRDWGFFLNKPMSIALETTGHEIWISRTADELLFKGYSDPLLNMGSKMPILGPKHVPYDKFGWFYKRNNSELFDGLFTVNTGEDNIDLVSQMQNWNHQNHTGFYSSPCDHVKGSSGDMWPPYRTRTRISMFAPDLCRTVTLDFANEVFIDDIRGYNYVAGRRNMDNGSIYAENACYCNGKCVPSGMLNVSACRYGGPAFMSYPHYFKADPYYNTLVNGMKPDVMKHQSYIVLEPTTGIPVDAAVRIQINVLIEKRNYVKMYENVSTIFFPVLWFEEKVGITSDFISTLKCVLKGRFWIIIVSIIVLAVGAILTLAACTTYLWSKQNTRKDLRLEGHDKKNKEFLAPLMNGRIKSVN